MKTAKQKRFAAVFAGMLCISCLSAPLAVDAESAGTAGENDSIATAEELPLNTAVSGDISAKGDVDFYQFTLPEDGLLQVSMIADWVSDFGDSYRITFYDADGNEISQDDYVHSNTQFPANGWTARRVLSFPRPLLRRLSARKHLYPHRKLHPEKPVGKRQRPMSWNPTTVSATPTPSPFPHPAGAFSTTTRTRTITPSPPTSPESSLSRSVTRPRAAATWAGVCSSTTATGSRSAKPN